MYNTHIPGFCLLLVVDLEPVVCEKENNKFINDFCKVKQIYNPHLESKNVLLGAFDKLPWVGPAVLTWVSP